MDTPERQRQPLETIRTVPTVGLSMFPCILPGSCLHVRAVEPSQVELGDVICFLADSGKVVAHRVIDFSDRGGRSFLVTRGDAETQETAVPLSAVGSVVDRVEHRLFSYDTAGGLGKALARMAVENSAPFAGVRLLFRVLSRVALKGYRLRCALGIDRR